MPRVALAGTLKQLEAQRQYGVFQAFVLAFCALGMLNN